MRAVSRLAAVSGAATESRQRTGMPMTAGILSNGRHVPAFGMNGGGPGALGINRLERQDGQVEVLDHIGSTHMGVDDVFVIETPGGGGFGAA